MLSFLIIIVLMYGIYIGARRGFALQLYYTLGYGLFFGFAMLIYKFIGPKFELLVPYPSASLDSKFTFFSTEVGLNLDKAFYYGFSFLLVCFIGWALVRFGGIFVKKLTFLPMTYEINVLGGSILAFVTNYIFIFMLLYLVAFIPIPSIQNGLAHSWLATIIVRYSPILTSLFTNLWVNII